MNAVRKKARCLYCGTQKPVTKSGKIRKLEAKYNSPKQVRKRERAALRAESADKAICQKGCDNG